MTEQKSGDQLKGWRGAEAAGQAGRTVQSATPASIERPLPAGADSCLCPFVCPECGSKLGREAMGYRCASCAHGYPILFGIPDFRLRSDRYLGLEEERAKARRLHEFAANASFDELVSFYYSITDDVPHDLAVRYKAYIGNAPRQAVAVLNALGTEPGCDALLDAGCGSGGLLIAAAGRYRRIVGVDIALRWLVIAQKRLDEQQVQAELVCADVEALPFAEGSFGHMAAVDLIEHVYEPAAALAGLSSRLAPAGRLWLSASNRFCLGPHPPTRVWAVGYLPRGLRSVLVRRVRGVDSLRHVHLLSPLNVLRACRRAGLRKHRLSPRAVLPPPREGYPALDRLLIAVYRWACRIPPLRGLLLLIGPAFELVVERRRSGVAVNDTNAQGGERCVSA